MSEENTIEQDAMKRFETWLTAAVPNAVRQYGDMRDVATLNAFVSQLLAKAKEKALDIRIGWSWYSEDWVRMSDLEAIVKEMVGDEQSLY